MHPNQPRSHQKLPKSCTLDIFSLLGLAKQFFFTALLSSKIITKQGQYHRNGVDASYTYDFSNPGTALVAGKGFPSTRMLQHVFLDDIISLD